MGASTPQKQGGSKSPRRKERGKEQKGSEEVSDALVKIGNQRPGHKPWQSKQSEEKKGHGDTHFARGGKKGQTSKTIWSVNKRHVL